MEKTVFIKRVYDISEKLNIPQKLVSNVLNTYIDFCKEELLKCRRISFLGLVYIVPEYEITSCKATLAFSCKEISKRCSCTYNTVSVIINEFFESMWQDIDEGKTVTIRGICTIYPLQEHGKLSRVQSAISQSLQEKVKETGNSVRCHTNLALKQIIKGNTRKVV